MIMEHIIAATDLRPASCVVSCVAGAVARRLRARMTLINVAARQDISTGRGGPGGPATRAEDPEVWPPGRSPREAARRRGALHRLLPGQGVESAARVLVGDPARRIRGVVRSARADLLVIGRGEERFYGPDLGRTARYLLERVRVPVLVVPPRYADEAEWSCPELDQVVAVDDCGRAGELCRRATSDLARQLRADASSVSAGPAPSQQRPGDARTRAEALLGAALALDAHVIALPAHGRLQEPRAPLGDVIEELLIQSPVPVLVYPVRYLRRISDLHGGEGLAA